MTLFKGNNMDSQLNQKYQYYLHESNRLSEELKNEKEYIDLLENIIIKLMEEGKLTGDVNKDMGSERYNRLHDRIQERNRRRRVDQALVTGSHSVTAGSGETPTRVNWKDLKKTYGDKFEKGFGG